MKGISVQQHCALLQRPSPVPLPLHFLSSTSYLLPSFQIWHYELTWWVEGQDAAADPRTYLVSLYFSLIACCCRWGASRHALCRSLRQGTISLSEYPVKAARVSGCSWEDRVTASVLQINSERQERTWKETYAESAIKLGQTLYNSAALP